MSVHSLVKLRDRCESLAESVKAHAFILGLLGAVLEAYRWLQTAVWRPIDGWAVVRLLVKSAWLDAPNRLLGLHKLVTAILDVPLFMSAPFAIGLVVWVIAQSLADDCRTELTKLGYVENEIEDYSEAA